MLLTLSCQCPSASDFVSEERLGLLLLIVCLHPRLVNCLSSTKLFKFQHWTDLAGQTWDCIALSNERMLTESRQLTAGLPESMGIDQLYLAPCGPPIRMV